MSTGVRARWSITRSTRSGTPEVRAARRGPERVQPRTAASPRQPHDTSTSRSSSKRRAVARSDRPRMTRTDSRPRACASTRQPAPGLSRGVRRARVRVRGDREVLAGEARACRTTRPTARATPPRRTTNRTRSQSRTPPRPYRSVMRASRVVNANDIADCQRVSTCRRGRNTWTAARRISKRSSPGWTRHGARELASPNSWVPQTTTSGPYPRIKRSSSSGAATSISSRTPPSVVSQIDSLGRQRRSPICRAESSREHQRDVFRPSGGPTTGTPC